MTFNEYIGMEDADADDGCIAARIRIEPHHMNPTGAVNGGVLLSLADNLATGMAGRAYEEKTGENAFMVGVDLHPRPPQEVSWGPRGKLGTVLKR